MLRPRLIRRSTVLLASIALLFTTIVLSSVARAADTQPPDGRVTVPLPGQTFSSPGPFILSGTATDDVGVTRGDVAIKDRTSGRWLQPNGTWGPSSRWLRATLSTPGALSTTWTYALSVPSGAYTVGFRAGDASGKFDASIPWIWFGVIAPLAPTADHRAPQHRAVPHRRPALGFAVGDAERALAARGPRSDVHQRVRRGSAVLPQPRRDPEGRLSPLHVRVQQRGTVSAHSASSTTRRRWRRGCRTTDTRPR